MPRSLRARAVVGAMAVVGVALVVGAAAIVVLTRSSLTGNVREAAELRAEDVVTALRAGGAEPADLAVEDEEDGFIQVVDAGGEVTASSPNIVGAAAVAELGNERSTVLDDAPIGPDRFVVVALTATTPDGEVTVLVGRALDGADEATTALLRSLAVIVPVVLLLVGLIAWRLVGRALGPVATMTASAREISATGEGRRLPEVDSSDELGELSATLNAMLDRLAASRDRLAAFVADAAHELRSPIAALRQHAEVAHAHPGTTEVAELAGTVRSESERLQSLVDDLLLLARTDEGDPGGVRHAVDLDDVVVTAIRRVEPPPAIDTSALSGGQVSGDPVALGRLVTNLVDNARRHAASRVAVALAEADHEVVLTVDDDGPGIPEADRERVFERFVRLDEARSRDVGGSGLGLAIVATVAEVHGATVRIEDSPLGGARLRVTFPAP
jgi:signal transduction histidine kinase